MRLFLFLMFGLIFWLAYNYGVAVGYIDELKKNPEIKYVAIKEVDIPTVYDAKQLNDYCAFEWTALEAL